VEAISPAGRQNSPSRSSSSTSNGFHKECIEPLTPDVKETLEALGRLAEVLSRAARDVSEEGGDY